MTPIDPLQTDLPPYFSEAALALRWQLACGTLRKWRSRGDGPAYSKLGGRIRYRTIDVLRYEQQVSHAAGSKP
ncbi:MULTISPECIES: helix-turn-helix domain-containing protein [Lysobacter]|uniref:helix-turn-helix domain-containing protein n=1 Tax=Lysobacter TaxID=68 RepID=UPI001F39FA3B|nr:MULTISPECIES: helix-turn-helix domain-containing protein [Lysobacter]UJB19241.1 helix-turn-helix domain-containing protein [Lysobacter capsici]UJQ27034.1 helix-turn-helix domain-containing protein [Lysobacter gummosus]